MTHLPEVEGREKSERRNGFWDRFARLAKAIEMSPAEIALEANEEARKQIIRLRDEVAELKQRVSKLEQRNP